MSLLYFFVHFASFFSSYSAGIFFAMLFAFKLLVKQPIALHTSPKCPKSKNTFLIIDFALIFGFSPLVSVVTSARSLFSISQPPNTQSIVFGSRDNAQRLSTSTNAKSAPSVVIYL